MALKQSGDGISQNQAVVGGNIKTRQRMFRCFGKKSAACRLRQVKYLQVKRKSVIAAVVQVIVIVLGTGIIYGKISLSIECYVVHIYNTKLKPEVRR